RTSISSPPSMAMATKLTSTTRKKAASRVTDPRRFFLLILMVKPFSVSHGHDRRAAQFNTAQERFGDPLVGDRHRDDVGRGHDFVAHNRRLVGRIPVVAVADGEGQSGRVETD